MADFGKVNRKERYVMKKFWLVLLVIAMAIVMTGAAKRYCYETVEIKQISDQGHCVMITAKTCFNYRGCKPSNMCFPSHRWNETTTYTYERMACP